MAFFKSTDEKFLVTITPCSDDAEIQNIYIETRKVTVTFYDLACVLFIDCFCNFQHDIIASKLNCNVKTFFILFILISEVL